MSSAAGAAAGAPGGDAGQQQGDAQGQQQAGGFDPQQFAGQFEQLQQGQEELRQFLASQPWQAQEQPGETDQSQQDPSLDLGFLDQDGYADPQQMAQSFQQLVQQEVAKERESWRQEHDKTVQRLTDFERRQEAEHLVNEFPEIAQPEVAQQVVSTSREYADLMGHPELADSPKFWRLVYAATRAFDAAKQEGSGDPGAAHLEGGAGAAPGQPAQVDLADLIVNGGQDSALGSRVLDFNR
jgi:hypothetical protein